MLNKVLTLALAILIISGCFSGKREYLFNGEDINNWVAYCEDENVDLDNYFYVKDGVIETPGVPLGYLRTKKKYTDYRLHVEWRYPEEPTNSGVFLHAFGPDGIWIKHFQAQLKYENAGDFIINAVGESAKLNDTVYTSTKDKMELIPKVNDSNEAVAGGEWNSYDIRCIGNTIEVRVNGLLQNVATECSQSEGYIGLQAEGSKIQFRNLWIEKIE